MAGEDARGSGGGEALPEAGGPPFWMERLTYDEAYNLVREERLDPQTDHWRDVSLDRPMPARTDDDDAGPASEGRWTIAWGDDDDPDGPPPPDDHAGAAAAPVELPPTTRRPCDGGGGTGN